MLFNPDTDYLVFDPSTYDHILLRRGPGLLDWGYALFVGKADGEPMRQVLIVEPALASGSSCNQRWITQEGELHIGSPRVAPFKWNITWKGKHCWLVNSEHYLLEVVDDTFSLRLKTAEDKRPAYEATTLA